ncbi:hypothetical protein [Mangrovicoccus ximenensis]|uniref:hypothetical protein n=1 Tax=Mangrovicoccus ximenensis TaxID=1911570 RepID=UPI000D3900DF|nr:hypothetical protein [Mangrovicoccus ximenensis]
MGRYRQRAAAGARPGAASGSAQLAGRLGVEPGAFSTAELAALRHAAGEDDSLALAHILSGTQRVSRDAAAAAAPADSQLARNLGVDASGYSVNDLAGMYLSAQN